MSKQKDPQPLSTKQTNIQNPLTPKKSALSCSQSHYNHHSHHSQQNHSNQKSISIQNSYAVSTGNANSSVSYAQLEIILENVQKVKKKAHEQISALEKKNIKLQQQCKSTKQQLYRYQHLQQTIRSQKQTIELKYQTQMNSLRQQLSQAENSNKTLSQMIIRLKQQVRDKNCQITALESTIDDHIKCIEEARGRYDRFVSILGVDEKNSEVGVVKQAGGLVRFVADYMTIRNSMEHHVSNLQDCKHNIDELKQQLSVNNKIINTITQQNNHLFKVVQQLNKQKQALSTDISSLQNQKSCVLKQKDQTLLQIQDQITQIKRQGEEQVQQKQQEIMKLKEQYKILEGKWMEVVEREKIMKQENYFKSVVEDVCSEFDDYENVLRRIKYLEKYRSQYYFNVEKIQYLCKILDS